MQAELLIALLGVASREVSVANWQGTALLVYVCTDGDVPGAIVPRVFSFLIQATAESAPCVIDAFPGLIDAFRELNDPSRKASIPSPRLLARVPLVRLSGR